MGDTPLVSTELINYFTAFQVWAKLLKIIDLNLSEHGRDNPDMRTRRSALARCFREWSESYSWQTQHQIRVMPVNHLHT